MKLSNYEQKMLDGKQGKAVKFAMQLIVKIGEIYRAEKLVEISSAHILAHYGSLHDAGVEFYEKLVSFSGECCITTTVDPSSLPERWEEYKIPQEYANKQKRLCEATKKLGVIQNWSCTPYEFGNIPRFGENVAWAESSAVAYVNSVLGARTNRTPAGLDIAAALTARMPKIGLYLSKNRQGSILVEVNAGNLSALDYHTVGYIIGKNVGIKIPIISGIPKNCFSYNLKCLGSAAASSGAVSMFHVLGITPEAELQKPLYESKLKNIFHINRGDIELTKEKMTTSHKNKVDLIALGCPHLSIKELNEVRLLLKGKKIKQEIKFWIYMSRSVYMLAKEMNWTDELEKIGVEFQINTCPVISPINFYGFKNMMTNSAKNANIVPTEHNIDVIYTDIQTCIHTAIE